MYGIPLVVSSTCLTLDKFWHVVMLYHNRPHLVNRKLAAVCQVLFYKITFNSTAVQHISELFTRFSILYEVRKLKEFSKEHISENFVREIIGCYDKNVNLTQVDLNQFNNECSGLFLSIRILISRNKNCENCIEAVILDKEKNSAIFSAAIELEKPSVAPPFLYEIVFTLTHNLRINLTNFEDADTNHAEWIAEKLFTKLLKWSENYDESKIQSSLSLVPIDEYCFVYKNLKKKYGEKLVKEWPKTSNTNPEKYIFEDIAIASYLVLLWQGYPKCEIDFVDCGCGNGLLVYVLNQEGYKGYGIDIRRRLTWDIYEMEAKLEVGTVTPSSRFPNTTWIIGNHSDELTPWIPVIALNSSPTTNFFVLPCCPYDFSGQKYIRTNTSVSQYSDYLAYIQNICEKCGFNTKTDKLRIPSTKRTCLVGIRKKVKIQDLNIIKDEVNKFIDNRLSTGFKPRPSFEKVRNCTQLNRDLIHEIILTCVENLLKEEDLVKKTNGEYWNKGVSLSISDLSKRITSGKLKELKKECGGLQTLLRNHRYLFEFREGKVNLREPLSLNESTKYKDKPCWFLAHHPNGCLFTSEECGFKH